MPSAFQQGQKGSFHYVKVMGTIMEYGIIFTGDTSPLAGELSEALNRIGLIRDTGNKMTDELLTALNSFRAANELTVLDFCDPVALRALGIDARGDEILLLARFGEACADTELGVFEACREIVLESRELDITLVEAMRRRKNIGALRKDISQSAVSAAILAFLHE